MRTIVDCTHNSLGMKERCLRCGVDHNPASPAFILRAIENPKRMSTRSGFFKNPTQTFCEFNRLSNVFVWMGTHPTIVVRIGRTIKFKFVNGDLGTLKALTRLSQSLIGLHWLAEQSLVAAIGGDLGAWHLPIAPTYNRLEQCRQSKAIRFFHERR